MPRLFFLAVVILLIGSCKEEQANTTNGEQASYEIGTEKWAKKSSIGSKANAIMGNWAEFQALEVSFDALYTVANRDDLLLVVEGLIEKEDDLSASEYPVEFGIPQIRGRQKMFRTFVLKVKGDLHYRLDPQASVKEMITAYNAFRNQFNVVVNNTLDTKLIFDE
ncbi:hypothetical protein [Maribacter sp. 2-571]|uniref:hypothetical protein n=1 Tax=Maribacter sp. 2-571 TaxID=3417569 RepID=UPI003D34DA82